MEAALNQPVGDRIHLDKNPPMTLVLPGFLRLFPEARILFALRDPRDVVVSCFLQYLPLNPNSVCFLTLERTARRFATDLAAWRRLRDLIASPWLEVRYEDTVGNLEREGKTVVVLLSGKRVEGLIALRDEPRPDAADAVSRLRAEGITTIMLTGDNARTGEAIGKGLGLNVRAELLPDAKLAAIAELKKAGPVAMVGDGINDAPALAAASVGIAMGGGTDVALETAEAALLRNRVTGVADLISLSRATLGNVWQNVALALGLKVVFLGTTLFGVTTLWMAILADTGATVLVTANALRLLSWGRTPLAVARRTSAE